MNFRLTITLMALALALSACSLRPPSVEPTAEDFFQSLPKSSVGASTQPASSLAATNEVLPQAAVIKTNLGEIEVTFYPESLLTVKNFATLSQQGFYNQVKFHRVIKGFMVQTGDPLSKDDDWSDDGRGGPGYTFADEINEHPLVRGSLAMANAGPNTNGSQFFIVTAEATPWLDGKHTNFGYVSRGLEVVDKIEAVATNADDHPLENIVITGITIIN